MAFGIRRERRKKPVAVESVPAPADTAREPGETQTPQSDAPQTAAPAEEPAQTVPQDTAESAAEDDAAENPAEAFYEQASDDPDAELTDDLFATLDFSVEDELNAILESIEGLNPTEGGTHTDA